MHANTWNPLFPGTLLPTRCVSIHGLYEWSKKLPFAPFWLQVLEVGCGTGPNVPYYPRNVDVTLTDNSNEVLAVARGKLKAAHPSFHLQKADFTKLNLPSSQFDTVVSTYTLCSVDDPARVVAEMKRTCKRGGKLLFLEHGLSHYWLCNYVINSNAGYHYWTSGCVWNRDVQGVIESSGVRIDSQESHHFGSTRLIVATNV